MYYSLFPNYKCFFWPLNTNEGKSNEHKIFALIVLCFVASLWIFSWQLNYSQWHCRGKNIKWTTEEMLRVLRQFLKSKEEHTSGNLHYCIKTLNCAILYSRFLYHSMGQESVFLIVGKFSRSEVLVQLVKHDLIKHI